MNSLSDIETRLSQLGENWPVGSVAEAVAKRLNSVPTPQRAKPRAWWRRLTLAGTVALLLGFALVWTTLLSSPTTLSAQVKAAIAKARSAHVTITIIDAQNGRKKAELWYSREHGLRAESSDEFIVDDGRQQWTWNPTLKESDLIVARRASRDAASMIADSIQLGALPADWRKGRAAEFDREIQGKRGEAHLVEPPPSAVSTAFGDSHPSPMRLVVWLDPEQRVVQIEEQRQTNMTWKARRETSIEYGIEVALEKFATKFPAAAKIVDADQLWADRFPLEKSLATAQSGGLLFAVHEFARCDDGMFYVVSSVRGTSEHLKKFPPQRRVLNLQTTILDVAEQINGASVLLECHLATLTSAELEGVHYMWWICVPRKFYRMQDGVRVPLKAGTQLEIEPGRIRIPLTARYRDPRAGTNWETVQVELKLPAEARPEPLVEIAGHARRDALLDGEGLNLFAGIKDNTLQVLRPASTTDAEFAKGIASTIEWLRSHDEVSGDTPAPATR